MINEQTHWTYTSVYYYFTRFSRYNTVICPFSARIDVMNVPNTVNVELEETVQIFNDNYLICVKMLNPDDCHIICVYRGSTYAYRLESMHTPSPLYFPTSTSSKYSLGWITKVLDQLTNG